MQTKAKNPNFAVILTSAIILIAVIAGVWAIIFLPKLITEAKADKIIKRVVRSEFDSVVIYDPIVKNEIGGMDEFEISLTAEEAADLSDLLGQCGKARFQFKESHPEGVWDIMLTVNYDGGFDILYLSEKGVIFPSGEECAVFGFENSDAYEKLLSYVEIIRKM